MKAMLLTEPSKLRITEFETPMPSAGELLVRVRACGICGSDVHGFNGSSGRRIPPLIMGHEAAGVVERVGAGVERLPEGDRVTFDSMISCGRCSFCRGGTTNLCDNRRILGVSCDDYRQHGAFAEYVVVPEHIVYRIPDDLSFEHAAMVEPVSVAVHAIHRTPVRLGSTAVVIGCGMIGLLCVQSLRAAGCSSIVAVDLDSTRRDRAIAAGANEALDPSSQSVAGTVIERPEGRGVDVAGEAVGASEPIKTAIESVRKGGSVTLIGNISPSVELPLQSVVTREIQLIGTCASNGDYPGCLRLMASKAIDVEPMITASVPLEEGPVWFDRLHSGEAGLMKIILQP